MHQNFDVLLLDVQSHRIASVLRYESWITVEKKCTFSYIASNTFPISSGSSCAESITHHCQPKPLQPICPSLLLICSVQFNFRQQFFIASTAKCFQQYVVVHMAQVKTVKMQCCLLHHRCVFWLGLSDINIYSSICNIYAVTCIYLLLNSLEKGWRYILIQVDNFTASWR